MILAKVYKTSDGAYKRATFENAHSKTHRYYVVRFLDGEKDHAVLSSTRWTDYTWRVAKVKKD